jgi:hypothetical protein
MSQNNGDQDPSSLYTSGTLNLRMPRLAQPGALGKPKVPKDKPKKIGVIKTKAQAFTPFKPNPGMVPLNSLLRPRRPKI